LDIDHVAIAVRDIDDALPYYTHTLGLTLVHDEELPSAGVRLAYLGGGATMLQLVSPIAPCPVADFLARHGEGVHHICLAVDSIPSLLASIPGQGGVQIVMAGRGRRACFLAAPPHGLRIEVTEHEPYREASTERREEGGARNGTSAPGTTEA